MSGWTYWKHWMWVWVLAELVSPGLCWDHYPQARAIAPPPTSTPSGGSPIPTARNEISSPMWGGTSAPAAKASVGQDQVPVKGGVNSA